MKTILLILMTLFIMSCTNNEKPTVTKMKVYKIEITPDTCLLLYCIELTSHTIYTGESDLSRSAFVDSVGKYNVGDKIEFSKVVTSVDTTDKHFDTNHSEIK